MEGKWSGARRPVQEVGWESRGGVSAYRNNGIVRLLLSFNDTLQRDNEKLRAVNKQSKNGREAQKASLLDYKEALISCSGRAEQAED